MGGTSKIAPCRVGDSVVSTILAVCNSVKNLSYIMHIVKEGDFDCNELVEITSRCFGGKECIVLSVSAEDTTKERSFNLSSSSHSGKVTVDESSAMKILLKTASVFRGVVWYWSTDLLGYSYILNADKKSMWIANIDFQELDCKAHETRIVTPSAEKQSIRILPFFYSDPTAPRVAMMGTGGTTGLCKTDLTVEIAALSRNAIDRAYCSAVSTSRCFCCEYIDSIHSTFHTNVVPNADVRYNLKLSKQFRQKVKGT
jgi:hypothetical protein